MTATPRRKSFERADMPLAEQVAIVVIVSLFAIAAACIILGAALVQSGWQ